MIGRNDGRVKVREARQGRVAPIAPEARRRNSPRAKADGAPWGTQDLRGDGSGPTPSPRQAPPSRRFALVVAWARQAPPSRRWVRHHCTFYGFMLCFASTSVAALYDGVFGWSAPYGYTSLPVLLGTAGGVGLIAGPAGLLALGRRRDPALGDAAQNGKRGADRRGRNRARRPPSFLSSIQAMMTHRREANTSRTFRNV